MKACLPFLNSFEVDQCCFYFSVNEKDHFCRICYFPELRNPRQVKKILNFQTLIFTFKMICILLLYLVQKLKPRWLKGKEFSCQCRRCRRPGFDPWVEKIPWRRKWLPIPVFLPGKSHGERSLVGPWGWQKSLTRLSDFSFGLFWQKIRFLTKSACLQDLME